METPVQIDFQGMRRDPSIDGVVAAHIGALEKRFGRITACRVVIGAPTEHHRSGAPYDVHIRLGLPDGREVNISRTPDADERHARLGFAVNDAFRRARRRLQERVRRMQRKVKSHDGPARGTVARMDAESGFGFIDADDGREVYFHENSVVNGGFRRLSVGIRVFFAEGVGDKGPQATTVHIAGKHRMR